MAYFPLFIDLKNKKCLIIGGGKVACRKLQALAEFGAEICVTAPVICDEIALRKGITSRLKEYEESDTEGAFLVIAATDDVVLNHRIALFCKSAQIHVNSVTSREDSSFLFPALVKRKDIAVGITSSGKCPAVSKFLREKIEHQIPESMDILLDRLESLRPAAQLRIPSQKVRKKIYESLLNYGLEHQGRISDEYIEKVVAEYEKGNTDWYEKKCTGDDPDGTCDKGVTGV